MQKRLVLIMLFFTMTISCSNPTTPTNNQQSDTIISGGNSGGIYLPDLTPPDGIIEEPVYDLPPIYPVQPGRPFYPEYPGDPGTNYGGIVEVVTPMILATDKSGREVWGTVWKIREKDSKRAEYLWTRILETFEGDNLGLGIVFGRKFEKDMGGEPKHPDLKYATPDTMRMYRVGKNFHQPFYKHARDFGTYLPSASSMIKQFKGAVIVGIDSYPMDNKGNWIGKYTIGGVYYNVGRLAYGNGQGYRPDGLPMYDGYNPYRGEDNFQTGGSKDEEIYIIRTDLPSGNYNGKQYWKVDLLFLATGQYEARGVVLNKSKIHKYSDSAYRSCNFNNPYLYAMKHSQTISLPRK